MDGVSDFVWQTMDRGSRHGTAQSPREPRLTTAPAPHPRNPINPNRRVETLLAVRLHGCEKKTSKPPEPIEPPTSQGGCPAGLPVGLGHSLSAYRFSSRCGQQTSMGTSDTGCAGHSCPHGMCQTALDTHAGQMHHLHQLHHGPCW